MKRIIFLSILATICTISAMAQDKVVINHQTTGGRDRYDIKTTVYRPSIVFTFENGQKLLTISGASGTCTLWINYYGTENTVFGPICINGEDDEVDISCLDLGCYTVALRVPNCNTFRWTLDMMSTKIIDGMDFIPTPANTTNGSIWDMLFEY